MDFHTEGRSPPAKRFFTLTSVICRERLWKSRTFPHRFFQRSMNLVFCLFLYYMLKLCFSEYYLYISTVWLLHHKTLLIWKFTVRLIISSRGSAKNDVLTYLLPRNFIFYPQTYILLFSSVMPLRLQCRPCSHSEPKDSTGLCLAISGYLICQNICRHMNSFCRAQQILPVDSLFL